MGVPTFMGSGEVVITKTPNGGFALSQNKDDPAELCPVFESWAACVYYLEGNFVPDPAA